MRLAMPTVEERFWAKVEKTKTCWLWTGSKSSGYGHFRIKEKLIKSHRFSYEIHVGPIKPGLTIDHLCRIRNCVRPAHLELVTFRENVLRGIGPTATNAKKTLCSRGHAFNVENTYKSRIGARACRQCQTYTQKKLYLATRSKRLAYNKKYYLKNKSRLIANQRIYYSSNRSKPNAARKQKRLALAEAANRA